MSKSNPGRHYIDFLKETAAFHRTVIYLLTAEMAAGRSPGSELSDAHAVLMKRIEGAYESPTRYITSRLFISQVAAFELFLQGVLADVLMKHPMKIGDIQFRLADVLEAGNKEELVRRAIDQMLNKLMYRKPIEYLADICSFLSVDREPLMKDWLSFVEIKARRDLGVHNGWSCNATYLRKLAEAGIPSNAKEGASMVPTDPDYLEEVHDVLDRLSYQFTMQVLKTHWPAFAEKFAAA